MHVLITLVVSHWTGMLAGWISQAVASLRRGEQSGRLGLRAWGASHIDVQNYEHFIYAFTP